MMYALRFQFRVVGGFLMSITAYIHYKYVDIRLINRRSKFTIISIYESI